jgi:hypothetical protein
MTFSNFGKRDFDWMMLFFGDLKDGTHPRIATTQGSFSLLQVLINAAMSSSETSTWSSGMIEFFMSMDVISI